MQASVATVLDEATTMAISWLKKKRKSDSTIEIERLGRDIKKCKFRLENQQQAGQIIT